MTHFSPHTIKGGPSLASRPQLNGKYTPMPSLKLAVKLGVLVVFGVLFASASAAEESKRNLIGEAAELNANTYGTSHGNKCINGANCFPPTRSGCPSGSYLNKIDSKCYSCPKVPNCTGGETCTHGGDSKCPRDKCVKGCNHDGKGSCIKPPPTPNCPSGQYWDVKYKRCKSCNSVENCNKVTCTGPNDHRCDPRGCREDCFHRDGKCHPKPPKQCALDEYWDNKLRKCVNCGDIPNCKVVECRSERDKWCVDCEPGFDLENGECSCPSCTSFNCPYMYQYFRPFPAPGSCVNCQVPNCPLTHRVCKNCNGGDGKCIGDCDDGYYNLNGVCTPCPSVEHCLDAKILECPCGVSVCNECEEPYEWNDAEKKCKCPEVGNCATYTSTCVCQTCKAGYTLNPVTKLCEKTIPQPPAACTGCEQTLTVSCGDADASSPVQLCISEQANNHVCVVGEVTNLKQLKQSILAIDFDIGLPSGCEVSINPFLASLSVANPNPYSQVPTTGIAKTVNKLGVHMWQRDWATCKKELKNDEITINYKPSGDRNVAGPFVANNFDKGWKNEQLSGENCIVPNGGGFEAEIVLGGEGKDDGCVQGFSFCLTSSLTSGCPMKKDIFNSAVWYARMKYTEGDPAFPAKESKMQLKFPDDACPSGGGTR